MALLQLPTFAFSCFLHGFWALMSLPDHKTLKKETKAFSVFVVKLYGFCLSISVAARPCYPYIVYRLSDIHIYYLISKKVIWLDIA